jgi:hypothetical protein
VPGDSLHQHSRLQAKLYSVHVDDVAAGMAYSSIAEAIADHADIAPEYARFVNIEYHGIRLVTMTVADMRSRTKELASDLMRMRAGIHASE